MRTYLGTTGALRALLGVAHFLRTAAERNRVRSNPGFLVPVPGIGLVATALCIWGWGVFARAAQRATAA